MKDLTRAVDRRNFTQLGLQLGHKVAGGASLLSGDQPRLRGVAGSGALYSCTVLYCTVLMVPGLRTSGRVRPRS